MGTGVILTQFASVQPPFDGDTDDELFDNILKKHIHIPKALSEEAKSILSGVSWSKFSSSFFDHKQEMPCFHGLG